MKKLILTGALVLSAGMARANPYFRLLDLSHPQSVAGGLIDPVHIGQSEAAMLVPLITHSPKDGCLLPSVVCEDWTPLAIGGSMNAGKLTFDVAPLANVLPWMQSGLSHIIPSSWPITKKLLEPSSDSQFVTFSAGPVWEYSQLYNKGYFKIFTGLALHF